MKELPTTIRSVTVFRDGALVKRIGTVELDAGTHRLVVSGIPGTAEADSIRVKGTGGGVLLAVDTRRARTTVPTHERVTALKKKLRDIEDETERIEHKAQFYSARYEDTATVFEDFARRFGKRYAFGRVALANLAAMDDKAIETMLGDLSALRELRARRRELEREAALLREEIERLGAGTAEEGLAVDIQVEVPDTRELTFEVTYIVSGAKWWPTYDVRVEKGHTVVSLTAWVNNTTHEDWEDVSLSVTTATAASVTTVEPTPLLIGEARPPRPKKRAARRVAGIARGPRAPGAPPREEGVQTVISEVMGGVVRFDVPVPVTMRAGKYPHALTLAEMDFESTTRYYWNAYAMDHAIAEEEATNGATTLVPGPVSVFMGDDYVGEGLMPVVPPNKTFKLGTRRAFDLGVERRMLSVDTVRKRISRGRLGIAYQYALTVKSHARAPAQVTVVDRVPHSDSEQISVSLDDCEPSPVKEEMGVLEWQLTVGPDESVEIRYSYTVEWEEGVEVEPPLL